jgi:hypothetical protein
MFIHSSPGYKFCTKLGNTATEMYRMLETVYGNQGHTCLQKVQKIQEEHEDLKTDPRNGYLSTAQTLEIYA